MACYWRSIPPPTTFTCLETEMGPHQRQTDRDSRAGRLTLPCYRVILLYRNKISSNYWLRYTAIPTRCKMQVTVSQCRCAGPVFPVWNHGYSSGLSEWKFSSRAWLSEGASSSGCSSVCPASSGAGRTCSATTAGGVLSFVSTAEGGQPESTAGEAASPATVVVAAASSFGTGTCFSDVDVAGHSEFDGVPSVAFPDHVVSARGNAPSPRWDTILGTKS